MIVYPSPPPIQKQFVLIVQNLETNKKKKGKNQP